MRVVITGASGNVGTSVLGALGGEPSVEKIIGIARRLPDIELPKVAWTEADVASTDLAPLFDGADAVVHLAWAIQPSRDPEAMERANVVGSRRVFDAVAAAGVPVLVHASSVGGIRRRPEGPTGRGGLADQWNPDLLLFPPQGRGRVAARRLRAGERGRESRPPASRADLQGRGSQ